MKYPAKLLIAITLLSALGGCGTLVNSSHQGLAVHTANDSSPKTTRCTVSNEEGSWTVMPDVTVDIHRDGNLMSIKCENDTQAGETSLSPKFEGWLLGANIIWDLCLFSCTTDGVVNSYYEYPHFVVVNMQNK